MFMKRNALFALSITNLQRPLVFLWLWLFVVGCFDGRNNMSQEQTIISNADAVLIKKCHFKSMRISTLTRGIAYQAFSGDGKKEAKPVIHGEGELVLQDQVYGEGNGDIHIRLQIRDGSIIEAEIRSIDLYKEACQEWAASVKAQLPKIEILFTEQ
jgi:hypothetical protein